MDFTKKNNFLGVNFNDFTADNLVHHIVNYNGEYSMLVTPNVDHVIRYNSDSSFKTIYDKADITVNDSRILNLLSKLARVDIGDVIPGSDLTKRIIETLPEKDFDITVIGCSDETISFVKAKYKLRSVNHYNPPMGFIDVDIEVGKCVDFVLANPAKLIFLCVGSPRQEILCQKLKQAGASGLALCVGASFLFLSGEEKRAPVIFQKLSLEWFFRLMQSPRRLFGRYVINGVKIFPIFIKYIHQKH
ncbi:WecB/TagA/CpsF family glycosyltransferase [Shewanella sp. 10N.286.48.A6]|uniref:WecB/TagA/CpsF family glycosyltransferase n=1 Tax=Shewanella sp. 10N.286.48.A6 TaxID=1880833 RepID=UPI000C83F29B|nr:WecB/TagA/CpsF family glycosyltransferase [Shewanella sp. 10N.286.48.A6]PMH95168.1 hypothetical protein BCU55_03035 [Shewanella sp. 10N.286.48.A6]